MTTEAWVTAERVARSLDVVKDTIYRWRERKGLQAHKIGYLWKFQLSEVDECVCAGSADEEVDYRKVEAPHVADGLGPCEASESPASPSRQDSIGSEDERKRWR